MEDIEMFKPHLAKADGFIYDIRTNPGGNTQLAFDIAGYFVKEKTHIGYQVVKKSNDHNDLTEPRALYIKASGMIKLAIFAVQKIYFYPLKNVK